MRGFDLGGLKAYYLMANLSPSQLFVMSLSRIMDAYNNDILPTIFTTAAHYIFFFDRDAVNQTVFMYNNTVTPQQSHELWYDADYGWSQYGFFYLLSNLIGYLLSKIGSALLLISTTQVQEIPTTISPTPPKLHS